MQIDAGLACDAVHTAQKHALKEKSNRDNDSSSNEKKYVSESIESRVGKKNQPKLHTLHIPFGVVAAAFT